MTLDEDASIITIVVSPLLQVQQPTRAVSSKDSVVRAKQRIAETNAVSHEDLNARGTLLFMPAELLQRIMTFILHLCPHPDLNGLDTAWRIDVYDTPVLMPISQTCRRLREIALDTPTLWTSVARGPPLLSRLLVERGRGLPLKAVLPSHIYGRDYLHETRGWYQASDVTDNVRMRIQDLYLHRLDSPARIECLISQHLPVLESLSLSCAVPGHNAEGSYAEPVSLSKDRVPQLRRLAISGCDIASPSILPSLTHLAIHHFGTSRTHTRIASILSACRALESLHLHSIDDIHSRRPGSASLPAEFGPYPIQSSRPVCHRLRRIALVWVPGPLVSLVLSLLLAQQSALALQVQFMTSQIFSTRIPANPPLCDYNLLSGVSKIAIGRIHRELMWYDRAGAQPYFWGVTAVGSQRTVRRVERAFEDTTEILSHGTPAALASVGELWLTDVFPTARHDGSEEGTLPVSEAAVLRALVERMSALETAVLVNQHQQSWACVPPSLALLPDGREDHLAMPRLRTVRIAYGYGPPVLHEKPEDAQPNEPPPTIPALDLTRILDELESGAYDYLDHLVLEVPRSLDVDAADLERLRGYFETVQIRMEAETPTVELPGYCNEPAAWRDDDPWLHRLWESA